MEQLEQHPKYPSGPGDYTGVTVAVPSVLLTTVSVLPHILPAAITAILGPTLTAAGAILTIATLPLLWRKQLQPGFRVDIEWYYSSPDCGGTNPYQMKGIPEKDKLSIYEMDSCFNLNGAAFSYKMTPHNGWSAMHYGCGGAKCVMHLYTGWNCGGQYAGTEQWVNRPLPKEEQQCHHAPYPTVFGPAAAIRSVQVVCCKSPFCEPPNPIACLFEQWASNATVFADLKKNGTIPEGMGPPPPVSLEYCQISPPSGWTEKVLRSHGHHPADTAEWGDPVWWRPYQQWCKHFEEKGPQGQPLRDVALKDGLWSQRGIAQHNGSLLGLENQNSSLLRPAPHDALFNVSGALYHFKGGA